MSSSDLVAQAPGRKQRDALRTGIPDGQVCHTAFCRRLSLPEPILIGNQISHLDWIGQGRTEGKRPHSSRQPSVPDPHRPSLPLVDFPSGTTPGFLINFPALGSLEKALSPRRLQCRSRWNYRKQRLDDLLGAGEGRRSCPSVCRIIAEPDVSNVLVGICINCRV